MMNASQQGRKEAGGDLMAQAQHQEKKMQEQKAKEEQINEAKNSMLSQILDQNARARLSTLATAKPEKAAQVEAALIQMARRGQIGGSGPGGKMSETALANLLEQFSASTSTSTVKFDRRRNCLDSSSDEEDYLY